jgi:nitroreductase
MDCACAIENMFLAAHSLGIGSCWINQLGTTCDDPEVRAFITSLGVPENHKVYGCVALGYADSKIPMKEKKVKDGTITIVK